MLSLTSGASTPHLAGHVGCCRIRSTIFGGHSSLSAILDVFLIASSMTPHASSSPPLTCVRGLPKGCLLFWRRLWCCPHFLLVASSLPPQWLLAPPQPLLSLVRGDYLKRVWACFGVLFSIVLRTLSTLCHGRLSVKLTDPIFEKPAICLLTLKHWVIRYVFKHNMT